MLNGLQEDMFVPAAEAFFPSLALLPERQKNMEQSSSLDPGWKQSKASALFTVFTGQEASIDCT